MVLSRDILTSMWPDSLSPMRNAATRSGAESAVPAFMHATTGIFDCCARAVMGNATPAAPTAVINSRRLVRRERSILRDDGGQFTIPPPATQVRLSQHHSCSFNHLIGEAANFCPNWSRLPWIAPNHFDACTPPRGGSLWCFFAA